jgi:O-antigen/teichoic acid export membrane protein
MFLISGMSENIILIMYGAKWIEARYMLLILAIVGMMKGVVHLLRSSILVKGKAHIILYATILELVSSLPLMYFFVSKYNVNGLLLGYSVGTLTSFFYIIYNYDKLFEKKFFYKTISLPIVFGVTLLLVSFGISLFSINLFIELTLQLFSALILFTIYMKVFHTLLLDKVLKRFRILKNRA